MPNIVRTGGGGGGKVEITVSAEISKSYSRALPSLPADGSQLASAVVGKEIAYAGYYTYISGGSAYFATIDVINVTTNTGRSAPVLPDKYTALGGGGVGSEAVFSGGYVQPDIYSPKTHFAKTLAYNTSTNTKRNLKDISSARAFIHTAAVGNAVVFAGGIIYGDNNNPGTRSPALDIVYPATNTIRSTVDFVPARVNAAATAAAGEAIFAGGTTGGYTTATSKYMSNVIAVNPSTGTIRSLVGLSAERTSLAAATIDKEVLFAGGESSIINGWKFVDAINVATGTRRALSPLTKNRRLNASATSSGTEALFAGGDTLEASVEAVNAVSGTTRLAGNLSIGRDMIKADNVNGEAVFGGGRDCRIVEVFSPATPNSFSIDPIKIGGDLILSSVVSVDTDCTYNEKTYSKGATLAYDPNIQTAVAKNISAGQSKVQIHHVLKKGSYTI